MATRTTTGAGDWNTAGNWDTGVPTVDDDAIVNHAMTVDGTGATFSTLDNNAKISNTANNVWVIKDGGSIDNAGGEIDTDDYDVDVSFVASTGASNWTWVLDSGTFDYGDGTHTFEYATFSISNHYSFVKGIWSFTEACTFTTTVAGERYFFDNFSTVNFSAGKTYTIGDGTLYTYIGIEGVANAIGSLGNEITFDGNNNTGYIYLSGTGNLDVTFDYCNFEDGLYGIYITSYDDATDSISLSNCNASLHSNSGFRIYNNISDVTFDNCNSFSNTKIGFYVYSTTTGGGYICNDCWAYSNGEVGFSPQTNIGKAELNRCKSYGNSSYGLQSDNPSAQIELESSLFSENVRDGIYITNSENSFMTNCSCPDNGADYSGVSVNLASGDSFPIKNTICEGSKYGISSIGTVDPVVTYSCVRGDTAAYNGMTDPTGTNGDISANPLFKDAAGDDYDLKNGSPCQNTGTSTGAPATDINDVAWPNTNPEMGAYGESLIPIRKGQTYMIA